MADIPYSEMRNLPPEGSNNPLVNAIDAARTAVCSIYESAPAQIVANNGLPDPTGIGRVSRGFFDNMCADKGLPPAPVPPFSGGQCAGTSYRVVGVYDTGTSGPLTSTVTVPGPISGPGIAPSGTNRVALGFNHGLSGGLTRHDYIEGPTGPGPISPDKWRMLSFSVTPVTGSDACGDPVPQFPPRQAPSTDFDQPITYPGPGGPITEPFKFPPISWPDLPDVVSFKPEIVVNVGGIAVVFDFDGASILPININTQVNIGGQGSGKDTNPLPPVSPPPQLDGKSVSDRLDKIDKAIADLKECACEEPPGPAEAFPVAAGNSACFNLTPGRTVRCSVDITQKPANPRMELGMNAPNVLYAGWAWFGSDERMWERCPVDSDKKIYEVPAGATRFCYTLRRGFEGIGYRWDVPA